MCLDTKSPWLRKLSKNCTFPPCRLMRSPRSPVVQPLCASELLWEPLRTRDQTLSSTGGGEERGGCGGKRGVELTAPDPDAARRSLGVDDVMSVTPLA